MQNGVNTVKELDGVCRFLKRRFCSQSQNRKIVRGSAGEKSEIVKNIADMNNPVIGNNIEKVGYIGQKE